MFFSFSTFLTGLTLHLTEAAGNPKCIPNLLETAMIAEVQMRKDGVNFSSAPVKLFSKGGCNSVNTRPLQRQLSPLQHTASTWTVELNLKALSVFTSPVSLRLDATMRPADAENGGSLIFRNITKNKENFPACVYIKANLKRVCSLDAHRSSAAPAGRSGGTQHGFMASLQ